MTQDLKKVIDKFSHIFWSYNNLEFINCNDLILSDRYYQLKFKRYNIFDSYNNYIMETVRENG